MTRPYGGRMGDFMDLELVRRWILGWAGMERVLSFSVDYYRAAPENGTIAPAGVSEVRRRADILGNVAVEQEVCFGLHFVLLKNSEEDTLAADNAQWLLDLQMWIQEQGLRGLAPVFGEDQSVRAESGTLKEASPEGTAVYFLRLTFHFTKNYEVM